MIDDLNSIVFLGFNSRVVALDRGGVVRDEHQGTYDPADVTASVSPASASPASASPAAES